MSLSFRSVRILSLFLGVTALFPSCSGVDSDNPTVPTVDPGVEVAEESTSAKSEDALDQFTIAVEYGDKAAICHHAGLVAEAFIQEKDPKNYRKWKDREAEVCEPDPGEVLEQAKEEPAAAAPDKQEGEPPKVIGNPGKTRTAKPAEAGATVVGQWIWQHAGAGGKTALTLKKAGGKYSMFSRHTDGSTGTAQLRAGKQGSKTKLFDPDGNPGEHYLLSPGGTLQICDEMGCFERLQPR